MNLQALSRKERETLYNHLQEQSRRKAGVHLLDFTKTTFPKFIPTWLHTSYYQKLNDFAEGRIKKLMVFMPPQHGKSEGSTRRLPAYLLGKRPDAKVAIISYNASKSRKFNREIQRIIDDPLYTSIFPATTLSNGADGFARTNDEFEIVGHTGGLKSVGVEGPLTGEAVDILIMDDLYKDAMSAWSPTVRENVSDWYSTVAETRLHNDSQQLIVFTRWHPQDLAGELLEVQQDWDVVVYPAIKLGDPTPEDPREAGAPLFPEKHNLEKLLAIRERNPLVFDSLYQQDPQPKEGLLYSAFKTYQTIPASRKKMRKAYIDTADTGADHLCSIAYEETEQGMYVLDVYYTKASMETTEPQTARQLHTNNVAVAKVESNNGGRGFARNLESQLRLLGNNHTKIKWFHQSENKQVRIFTRSAEVTNLIHFPENWHLRWPEFYKHVTSYKATGGNAHDDAEDVLTGMVENYGKEINRITVDQLANYLGR